MAVTSNRIPYSVNSEVLSLLHDERNSKLELMLSRSLLLCANVCFVSQSILMSMQNYCPKSLNVHGCRPFDFLLHTSLLSLLFAQGSMIHWMEWSLATHVKWFPTTMKYFWSEFVCMLHAQTSTNIRLNNKAKAVSSAQNTSKHLQLLLAQK